ncbi:MAG: hypothetical protein IK089_07005 [Oxalobacter sp.]|nr:hypothetical protein [Oxalobacter sp.]
MKRIVTVIAAVAALFVGSAQAQTAVTCMQDRYGNITCPVMTPYAPATGAVVHQPASGIGTNETAIAIAAIGTLGAVYTARETYGHYYHRHHHRHHW